MKKIVVYILFTLFCVCSYAEKGYEIKLKIPNLKDKTCYLGYNYADKKYLQDTAIIAMQGDYFIFNGEETLEGGIFFFYTPGNVYFEILVTDDQHFTVETDTVDLIGKMNVTGSEENMIFRDFQLFMRDSQTLARELNEQAKSSSDNASVINDRLKELDQKVKMYRENLIRQHEGTFVSNLIKATIDVELPEHLRQQSDENTEERYHFFKRHYFDNINFSDARLLRTPILHNKFNYYLDKLTVSHPDSITESAVRIIEKSKKNKEVFRYAVVSLTNKYETSNIMGMDGVFVNLAEKYYVSGEAFWADDELVDKISKRIKEIKPTLIGKKAPALFGTDTLGNVVNLEKINAKYIVLYFYDPDCGHCRKKTPVLKELYPSDFKSREIEIISVCTVTDQSKWKKFVREHKIPWKDMADPNLRCNFRAEYNINTTPKLFILDRDKKIIAKQLDVEQIVDFIDKYNNLHQM
ncbi:MAG: redoxin domain-containing protein [Cyclobacteriaceae bacterium]|nr:redoxin domain-containing protein [Cyclobacteriaceae bacterium]